MKANCQICGGQIPAARHYCNVCGKLMERIDSTRSDGNETLFTQSCKKALKAAVSGSPPVFKCYYTKINLELTNSFSPWYLSFDHRTPGDDNDIVVTSQYLNCIKADLDEEEFKNSIQELFNCFNNNMPINVSSFTFKYWKREINKN
jgi:hypothetical protein